MNSIQPAVIDAECKFGVPAPILAGMAIEESGYGLTRLALKSNNILAFKWPGANLAHGLRQFVLWCQPDRDKGNVYPAFNTRADAIDFVAWRLQKAGPYAQFTARYQTAVSSGQDRQQAAIAWLKDLAPRYNWNPTAYIRSVLAKVNDPIRANGQRDPSTTLWSWSPSSVVPTRPSPDQQQRANHEAGSAQLADPASPAQSSAESYLKQKLLRARYMSNPPARCDAQPIRNWPNYEGRDVTRCVYTVTSNGKPLSALVYLLNPTLQNVAERIGNACAAVGKKEDSRCGKALACNIVRQNGGQFPVAGFVIERKEDAGGEGPDPVYLEFRDGVTVVTEDQLNFTDKQLSIDAMEHAAHAPVLRTRTFARIANATRAQYRSAGGTAKVGNNPKSDPDNRWLPVVRANEFKAQDSGIDDLLRGVAMVLPEC